MKDNVLLHTVQKERLGHVVQDVEDSEIVYSYLKCYSDFRDNRISQRYNYSGLQNPGPRKYCCLRVKGRRISLITESTFIYSRQRLQARGEGNCKFS